MRSYLRGVPSSWGWIMTTLTLTDVRSRSIICSWVRVATATLQISTSRLPCLSPAFQAKPKGSTSATMPSKLTWKPSWPRLFRRNVISDVSQPLVVIWSQKEFDRYYLDCTGTEIENSNVSEILLENKVIVGNELRMHKTPLRIQKKNMHGINRHWKLSDLNKSFLS